MKSVCTELSLLAFLFFGEFTTGNEHLDGTKALQVMDIRMHY